MREINYEPEVEADADVIAILFSRTLRSLPLGNSTLNNSRSRQTTLRCPLRAPAQRTILTKIHNDSRSLWGSY